MVYIHHSDSGLLNTTDMDNVQKHNDDIAYFIAFCLETYKNANGMNGAEVSELFSMTRLTEFLAENFESIHTQSPQWIIEEINEYLSSKQKKS